MNIKPLSDHILIKPIEEKEKTESGIFLPETAKEERPEQGEVMAVGPGKRDEKGERVPMEVKKGDKVLFTKYGPTEMKIKDEDYLIASQDDILAIIQD